jgi:hypothetical protein
MSSAGAHKDVAVRSARRQDSLLTEPLPLPLLDREEADREFPEVHAFGGFMLRRLVQHRHKGAQTDWQQDPIAGLLRGALRELSELEQVHGVLGVRDPDRIALMAADVANYALLVADACYQQAAGVGLAGISQEESR